MQHNTVEFFKVSHYISHTHPVSSTKNITHTDARPSRILTQLNFNVPFSRTQIISFFTQINKVMECRPLHNTAKSPFFYNNYASLGAWHQDRRVERSHLQVCSSTRAPECLAWAQTSSLTSKTCCCGAHCAVV